MKRIATALGNLNQQKRAYAVFALCAATAMALPAQTFTSLHSFDVMDGGYPNSGAGSVDKRIPLRDNRDRRGQCFGW